MDKKSKIGILKYVAKSGAKGCKFDDEPDTWYNPATDAAKEMIKEDMIGNQVEIMMVPGKKTEFSSIVSLEAKEEKQLEVKEELVEDEKKSQKAKKQPVKTPEEPEQLGETSEGVPTGASHVPAKEPEQPDPELLEQDELKDGFEGINKEEQVDTIETDNFINSVSSFFEKPGSRILNKLCKIQQELKVPKSNRNDFAKFNYRSMTDILEGIKPLLKKYEVCIIVTDTIKVIGNRIYVEATATIYDNNTGNSVESKGFAREAQEKKGMDEAQITGSASSYARKYALNGLLAIDDTADIDSQKQEK